MDETFRKNMINELMKLPHARRTQSHVIVRCPFCGDSKKDPTHVHYYIAITKEKFVADCKKCSASGLLNAATLEKLNITEPSVVEGIKKDSFNIVSRVVNLNERMKRLNVTLPINSKSSKLSLSKFKYLEDRLLHDFNNEIDINKYRIVYNLNEFIKMNHIKVKKSDINFVNTLNNNYVGFLSFFGNSITFRLIDDKLQSKGLEPYYVYSFSDTIRQPFVYIPSIPIDPLSSHPRIHISESIFDLIGSKLRYKLDDNFDTIYVSAQSVGAFRRSIKHALMVSGYFGAEIDCYLDNDNKAEKIKDIDLSMIQKSLRGLDEVFKVNIYTPKKFKDFGDLREDVEIMKTTL